MVKNHPPLNPESPIDVGCEDRGESPLLNRHHDILSNHVHHHVLRAGEAYPLDFHSAGQLLPEYRPPAFPDLLDANQQGAERMNAGNRPGRIPHLHHRHRVCRLERSVEPLLRKKRTCELRPDCHDRLGLTGRRGAQPP